MNVEYFATRTSREAWNAHAIECTGRCDGEFDGEG